MPGAGDGGGDGAHTAADVVVRPLHKGGAAGVRGVAGLGHLHSTEKELRLSIMVVCEYLHGR
jgi:hypothetical protein